MFYYNCPVTVADFQSYIRDSSTDTALLAFYQACLDAATEQVFTWLGVSYDINNASWIEKWIGDGTDQHRMRRRPDTLLSLSGVTRDGVPTGSLGVGSLRLFDDHTLLVYINNVFDTNIEYSLAFQQNSNPAPEAVSQVIIEIAATILAESKRGDNQLNVDSTRYRTEYATDTIKVLDLTERHERVLSQYRRIAV